MNFMRRLPGALAYFARTGVTSVAGNLSLAVLALALAVSLWLYVTDQENPREVQTFNSAIPIEFVNVPTDLAVANAAETSVRIRIEATQNDLEGLQNDDFTATVDLGGYDRGDHSVPIDVDSPSGDISIVDVTPARVDVRIETSRTKEVPVRVRLVGSPQSGFAAEAPSTDPQTAVVSGAESLVALVDAVVAEMNLTGQRVDITNVRVDLEPRDARDGAISRVNVSPQSARVSVDVVQQEFSLEFRVAPVITGQPAAGYNVSGVAVDPRVVVVTGPLDVLETIDAVRGISTEEISIADTRDDVVRTLELQVPPNARVEGSRSVRVTVDVTPARGEFSFSVVPQVRNLGDGLTATVAQPVVVTLTGEVPQLQSVTAASIVVAVDADGLGAGLYALPVIVTPPEGTEVARIEPPEAGVALAASP